MLIKVLGDWCFPEFVLMHNVSESLAGRVGVINMLGLSTNWYVPVWMI